MSDLRTKCGLCDGRGKVRGLLSILRSCPDCDGTGQIPNVVPSAWLGEAEAALVLAEKAERNCGMKGDWNSLVALEGAVRGLRAAIALSRSPSPSNEAQR